MKLIASVLVAAAVLTPALAFAQDGFSSPITAKTIQDVIDTLLKLAVLIVVPLAAFGMMVGAFFYITSGGNPTRITQANQAITYAVIGIVVAISAQFVRDVVVGVAQGATVAGGFVAFIENMVRAFGQVLMGLSVLAILYASFLFLTGGQDEAKITQAKRVLTFAVIGLLVAILAFTIPKLVADLLQQNVLK